MSFCKSLFFLFIILYGQSIFADAKRLAFSLYRECDLAQLLFLKYIKFRWMFADGDFADVKHLQCFQLAVGLRGYLYFRPLLEIAVLIGPGRGGCWGGVGGGGSGDPLCLNKIWTQNLYQQKKTFLQQISSKAFRVIFAPPRTIWMVSAFLRWRNEFLMSQMCFWAPQSNRHFYNV